LIHENNLLGKCGIAVCDRPVTGAVTSPASGFELVGMPIVEMGGPLEITQGSAFLPEKILLPVKATGGTFVPRKASDVGLTNVKTIAGTSAVFRLKWKDTDPIPDALRDQAAKDFYNRFSKIHDYTFSGVQKWQPTAFDDCVVVWQTRFSGMDGLSGGFRCQTRVRSWTQNLIPETMVAAGKVDTAPPVVGGGESSCGNCLSCLDASNDNSHEDCGNLSGPAADSWFLYKDTSDCCDNSHDNNIELIHDTGCVWKSKEYACKERFIEEPWLNPGQPEVVESIFFRFILTVGATWTELEQRFYRKT